MGEQKIKEDKQRAFIDELDDDEYAALPTDVREKYEADLLQKAKKRLEKKKQDKRAKEEEAKRKEEEELEKKRLEEEANKKGKRGKAAPPPANAQQRSAAPGSPVKNRTTAVIPLEMTRMALLPMVKGV